MASESPIRAARERLGLSRDELGRILSVSGRTVSYWESRSKLPDPGRADALRKTLGLSEVDLWRALHRAAPKVAPQRRRERPW
jgi:transcriptional regulator with XRE-family HTH domain